MREIKFRAWDKEKKEMVKFPTFLFDENGYSVRVGEKFITFPEIMQFTGLRDKNGKEIYEGDIVFYNTFFYGEERQQKKVIEWKSWTSDDFGQPDCIGYFNVCSSMTIIGNIYENPELLNS